MQKLTPHLLDTYPYRQYADAQTIQSGFTYHKIGRVWDVTVFDHNTKALCEVEGNSGDYTVEIMVDEDSGRLGFECDCPYAENHFCKHMVAAAMEVSAYLKENDLEEEEEVPSSQTLLPSGNWQNKLKETLSLIPRRASAAVASHNRYVALVILTRSQFGYYDYRQGARTISYSLEPFIIKANEWNLLQGEKPLSLDEINKLLDSTPKWIKAGSKMYQQINPAGCLNLNHEAVSFLNILQNLTRIYGTISSSSISMYLSMLARLEIPVFLGSFYPDKIDRRVHLIPQPVNIKIDMQSDESKLTLQAGFEYNEIFTLIHKQIETVSNNPTWVLMDDHVAQINNAQALSILPSFPIVIPAQQVDIFREQYFAQIAQVLPIKSDIVHWQDVNADPAPRLYLHDDQRSSPMDKRSSPMDKDNVLRADLRFGYGDYELPLSKDESFAVETIPDSWDLVRIHRQPAREDYFYQLMTDPSYRLKRANSEHPYGTFELRARAHPYDFRTCIAS